MRLPIAKGFYRDKSLPISHQECVNCYPNIVQTEGAYDNETLYGTPGIVQLTTTGTVGQINRGGHTMLGIPYFVNGQSLYRLDRSFVGPTEVFTTTTIGIIAGTARVSIADNGTQMLILVPGGNGYIYTAATSTLAVISDVDFTANGNPQYVIFVDGYFACFTDSKKWIVSNLNDGTSWSAPQFGTAESDPDNISAMAKLNNQVYLLGSVTTEGNQNIGGYTFPFQRNNVFLDKGCAAKFSVINADQSFFMLGGGDRETPAIWQFKDNQYTKVSTTAIDDMLSGFSDIVISNCFAWSYAQSGAYFVGFTFSSTSIVYDTVSGLWHERKSISGESVSRWRVNCIVEAYNKIIVGDAVDGRIGYLDLDTYSEYGDEIIRIFTTMPYNEGEEELIFSRLELTMESGVGNADDVNPVIELQTSKNGKTFNNPRPRKIGAIGEYHKRIVWKRNGRFPKISVLRFTMSSKVKFVIIKLEGK